MTPADSLFPSPGSVSGRVLGYLMSLEVPGTSIETRYRFIVEATGLSSDDVRSAIEQLGAGGLVAVEAQGADADQMEVTVLLAPPPEDYGVRARWAQNAHPVSGFESEQSAATTTPTRPTTARRTGRSGPRGARRESPVSTPQPLPLADIPRSQPVSPPTRATGAAGPAQLAPAAAIGPGTPITAGTRPGRRTEPGAAVDETALVRGFVERFERLLTECDEHRRRAEEAEERATALDKLLRAAERRAAAAEAKLEASQDKLRSWADLTQRMQQLSRLADTAARPKGAATRGAAAGPAAPVVGRSLT